MVLESLMHAENSFATLTYDEANLPSGGTLVPRHLVLFLKRLRKELPVGSLRFFAVGEYGDLSQRPHYHLALFGLGPQYGKLVEKTWSLGNVMLGDLTPASARYIAGYVTKKMTSPTDPRLNGRYQEFSRMSRMPGIGCTAIPKLSKMLEVPLGLKEIDKLGDVPASLKHGNSQLPLGRYLREKLRQDLGFIDYGSSSLLRPKWKDIRDQNRCEEDSIKLSAMWLNFCSSPQAASMTFHQYLEGIVEQQTIELETRFRIKERKSI